MNIKKIYSFDLNEQIYYSRTFEKPAVMLTPSGRPLPVVRYCLLSEIVPVDRSPNMGVLRSLDLCIAGLMWLRSGPWCFDLSVMWCRYLGYNSVGRRNGLCVQIWRWSPSTYEPESAKGEGNVWN